MRKSCIKVMRKSRLSSLDHSTASINESSLDMFQKTEFGHRLTLAQMGRTATQKILERFKAQKSTLDAIEPIVSQKQLTKVNTHKIPEYQFLKNKQQVQADPFLKAKMKYLVNKEKPQLLNEVNGLRLYGNQKKNTQNIQNQKAEFTTFRKQSKKENNKKLLLLSIAGSKHKPHE